MIAEAPVAEKMSWAAKRCTSREDIAYCLFGLSDVNMPFLHGEGNKTFMRLQPDIVRISVDESVFAWRRQDADLLSTNITETLPLKSWEHSKVQTYFHQNEAMKARERATIKPDIFLHSGLLAQQAADFVGSGDIN